ncbi:MAG: hypothetical protein U0X40_01855 [Ferruginibacter sp.]
MELTTIIYQILVGGLLGTLGQGIRVIIGLKKMNEGQKEEAARRAENPAAPEIPGTTFSSGRLWLSLLIGFIAGALGGLFAVDLSQPIKDKTVLSALIGIGYAGTDFIEGFMSKVLPGNTTAAKAAKPGS